MKCIKNKCIYYNDVHHDYHPTAYKDFFICDLSYGVKLKTGECSCDIDTYIKKIKTELQELEDARRIITQEF